MRQPAKIFFDRGIEMYRISPTLMDAFRIFRDEEYKTEQDLQAAIRKEFVPTPKMAAGKAFHKIKDGEEGIVYDGAKATVDGMTFRGVMAGDENLIKEIKIVPTINTNRGMARMPMVADGIWGNTITEYKTTYSYIDVLRYADSMQWRCYLWGFSAEKVIYDIYYLGEDKSGIWSIKDNQRIDFCPYARMEADIKHVIVDLIDYCEPRWMLKYITEEGTNDN